MIKFNLKEIFIINYILYKYFFKNFFSARDYYFSAKELMSILMLTNKNFKSQFETLKKKYENCEKLCHLEQHNFYFF